MWSMPMRTRTGNTKKQKSLKLSETQKISTVCVLAQLKSLDISTTKHLCQDGRVRNGRC
jgi:hypothetical protein